MAGSIYDAIVGIVPGLASAAIAFGVYRLSQTQREENWLRALWEFQCKFWLDERMEKARAWIACNDAYQEIKPILVKRMAIGKGGASCELQITKEEYAHLETLDRFAALLLGYRKIAPKNHKAHEENLYRIFDDYWLRKISDDGAPELKWYFLEFYQELFYEKKSISKFRINSRM